MDDRLFGYRVSICGISELPAFEAERVSHVVSILDPSEPVPAAFERFPDHARETYRFDDATSPRPGTALPERTHIADILAFGERLAADKVDHLLVHCHAGISRSTASVAILSAQARPGREADIFAGIRVVRPRSWPNSLMIQIADDILGLQGNLARALRDHHRRMAEQHPDLVEIIRLHGRAHEIPDD